MYLQIIYILIYMYKQDLVLNNLQWLICHETKQNQKLFYGITVHWNVAVKYTQEEFRDKMCLLPLRSDKNFREPHWRLVGSVLWHINLCRLFNANSIFIQIVSSISNN